MTFEVLVGPLFFLGGLIAMFLIVPRDQIRDLLPVGLVGGLGVSLVTFYVMQELFRFWVFQRVDVVTVFGVPLFLSATWIPVVIIFSYLLMRCRDFLRAGAVLLVFPLGAAFVQWLLVASGFMVFNNWQLTHSFLLSLGLHFAIGAYLYASNRLTYLYDESLLSR